MLASMLATMDLGYHLLDLNLEFHNEAICASPYLRSFSSKASVGIAIGDQPRLLLIGAQCGLADSPIFPSSSPTS